MSTISTLFEQVHEALNTERCHELEIIDGPNRERGYRWIEGLTLNASHPDIEVNYRAADRLEHNYGHGQQHLATVFAQLMMLAFLVDQVQESSCRLFQAARNRFHARIVLWERLRNLFIDFDIPDWTALWAAMIRSYHAVLTPNTS